MRTFLDAKTIAKTLRSELAVKKIELTHSESLELVSRLFGFKDWNSLATRIGEAEKTSGSNLRIPEGWVVSGSRPDNYILGTDPDIPGVAMISSKSSAPDNLEGFGTLMQSFLADTHIGQRLRLVADLKADSVTGSGTIWMRIDAEGKRTLRFDNMEERQIGGSLRGTTDWTRREIVLEVPKDAHSIHFGFYLNGVGSVRARNFDLRLVSNDVGVTTGSDLYQAKPVNLNLD